MNLPPIDSKKLVNGNVYILEWANPGLHYVIKCRFINYFDNTVCETNKEFIRQDPRPNPPPPELIGSVYQKNTRNNRYYPITRKLFEDPSYPYQFVYKMMRSSCNLGVFEILNIKTADGKVPDSIQINSGSEYRRDHVMNATKMWVDLDAPELNIRRSKETEFLTDSVVRQKTSVAAPDIANHVFSFLGGLKGGKTRSKRRVFKTKKRQRKQNTRKTR